jgi:hypothetical protein
MKSIVQVLLFVLISSYSLFGFCGELRFFIDDDLHTNYQIIATRISLDDPLFGTNFMMIDPSETTYNYVVSGSIQAVTNYPPFDFYLGFDFVRDQGNYCWPFIGEGKYFIGIYRDDQPSLIGFYIDLISYEGDSPDIFFEYTASTNHLEAVDAIRRVINNNDWVNAWEIRGYATPNLTSFENNIEITNSVNGGQQNSITTTLGSAQYGFPYDPPYPVGYEFAPGEQAHFWRGAFYGFSISPQIISNNKFRSWKNYNNYSPSTVLQILSSTDEIHSQFFPFQTVPVNSYLEGGTSTQDDYEATWLTTDDTETLHYGTAYDGFIYQSPTNDLYSFYAKPISTQHYNTTWSFFNWNTGSYSSTISDLRIPDSIPSSGSFVAKYKGHMRSDYNNSFNTSGQRHLIRDANGYYHLFYISMDHIWYTKSQTTNFGGSWYPEDSIDPDFRAKSLSADIYGNKIYIVFEANFADIEYGIYCWVLDLSTGQFSLYGDSQIASITPSYLGNALPVVAVSENEQFFLYRKNSMAGLYYTRSAYCGGRNYYDQDVLLSGTSFTSINPSLAVDKVSYPNLHLAYQHNNLSTKVIYRFSDGSFCSRTFTDPDTVSKLSTYLINTDPSISLFKKDLGEGVYRYEPIVSWIGRNGGTLGKSSGALVPEPRVIIRPGVNSRNGYWGNTRIEGEEVDFTQNNSVENTADQSVIAWTQKNGTESKWIRRDGTTYYGVYCIDPIGYAVNISNGTSLSNLKAISFDKESLPYVINKSGAIFSQATDCGGQGKVVVTYPFTFSRAGVILKNGIEFAYYTGDVVLDDSAVQFINIPDTLAFGTSSELNQVLRTVDFPLSSVSDLMFSNCYYVLNKELADSLMPENESVGFRVELVNSSTGNIAGTFDNIVYDKNNLDDYENISYQLDCSGISEGNYFFRLVTFVDGNAEYGLVNAVNDAVTVAKRSHNEVLFTGEKIPVSYDLSQNYPNPFNPVTTINYQLPQTGFVTLKTYDILGKEVATLVNEQKNQGRYSVDFNASHLASGVYIYQLRVNDYVSSKKMILLK